MKQYKLSLLTVRFCFVFNALFVLFVCHNQVCLLELLNSLNYIVVCEELPSSTRQTEVSQVTALRTRSSHVYMHAIETKV